LELSGDWASLNEAESEDRRFLLTQLDETENELVKLQQFITPVLAGLQISASPVKKNVDKKETANVAVKPADKAAVKPATPAVEKSPAAKSAAQDVDPAKLMASMHLPKMKGKAALAPMLAMLKGLYQDSKDRISQQNAREEKSKKWFADKEAEHKAKLATIEGRYKNGTLSEEFHTNETRDETRYFSYWSRCRERQHRQFHTNLKIQHAMMMKTKKMIETYEKALSGKASDNAQAQKQISQMTGGGMPEIVFLQDVQRTVGSFCRESLAEVRKERAELKEQALEGLA